MYEPTRPRPDRDVEKEWSRLGSTYRNLINDDAEGSSYLREVGLKPVVARLLGDCASSRVLDVGTGGGWLFDVISSAEAHGCDLVRAESLPKNIEFKNCDASRLEYADERFDVVVANLVLCYCADIRAPLKEMARVCKPGGRLLISLVHPFFYRTGEVDAEGDFRIMSDLSRLHKTTIAIGNSVGPLTYFYRPYADYLNGVMDAGWTLRRVEDWFFDGEDYRSCFPSNSGVRRSQKVPVFSFFLAER